VTDNNYGLKHLVNSMERLMEQSVEVIEKVNSLRKEVEGKEKASMDRQIELAERNRRGFYELMQQIADMQKASKMNSKG
jgi:hypothetical protein